MSARQRRDRRAERRIAALLDEAEKRKRKLARLEEVLRSLENSRAMIVLHEATHQLVFNSGLLRNPPGDPRWLHEGLAMLFESARGGRWRGLATPNIERLRAWRRYAGAGRLPALAGLLTNQQAFLRLGPETHAHYAAAWALTYYLTHRRRADLERYLRLVARHRPGPVSRQERLADFTAAFGADLAALEADWHAYMKTVRE